MILGTKTTFFRCFGWPALSGLTEEVTLSLREALLGFERSIVHLDGRRLQVAFDGVTKPFAVMKVTGEGGRRRSERERWGESRGGG